MIPRAFVPLNKISADVRIHGNIVEAESARAQGDEKPGQRGVAAFDRIAKRLQIRTDGLVERPDVIEEFGIERRVFEAEIEVGFNNLLINIRRIVTTPR